MLKEIEKDGTQQVSMINNLVSGFITILVGTTVLKETLNQMRGKKL